MEAYQNTYEKLYQFVCRIFGNIPELHSEARGLERHLEYKRGAISHLGQAVGTSKKFVSANNLERNVVVKSLQGSRWLFASQVSPLWSEQSENTAKRCQNFHINWEESLPTVSHKMSRTLMTKSRVNPIGGEERDGFSTSMNDVHRRCLSHPLFRAL